MEVIKMKVYAAIGHFNDSKNITAIAFQQNTKKDFLRDCYGNAFVPYVVLTEKTLSKVQECRSSLEIFETIKGLTSNFRVWDDVTEYLEQCFDLLTEKVNAAKEQG
jgi:hypothetical protein